MLQMILRKLIFTVIGKVAGGKTARNLRSANKVTRMARRMRR